MGHRWLALALGLQLLAWTASGLYMASVDIDVIHGDPLVRNLAPPVRLDRPLASIARVLRARDDVAAVHLRTLPDGDQAVFDVVDSAGSHRLFDATTGVALLPFEAARVRSLAEAYYAGRGRIAGVRRLGRESDLPREVRGRHAPLWRVDFDDWLATSLYLHPDTGQLVTRRHRLWRWYDLLWSLHIMDYGERENVNNKLLRVATPLAALTATFGAWLAFYSFAFLRRRRPARGPA